MTVSSLFLATKMSEYFRICRFNTDKRVAIVSPTQSFLTDNIEPSGGPGSHTPSKKDVRIEGL